MSGTEKEFLEEKVQILELQCDAARERVVSLEKENAELKKDKEYLDKVNNEQTEVILKLNEQIEKMENCWNCKFFKERKYQACIDYKKNNTKCCAFYKWG